MRITLRVLLPAVLACALCAVVASPAFAFTGANWLPSTYPIIPPTPSPTATAPNGELVTALLAGSSVHSVDGWNQVYCTGTPYQIGFQNGFYGAVSLDQNIWFSANSPSNLTWSGTPYKSTPTKASAAISNECISGVAQWPLIPVEYQQELQGIADGEAAWFAAEGLTDPDNLWDVVAANAAYEYNADSNYNDSLFYTTGGSITAVSVANPTVITTKAPNGLVSGMSVTIKSTSTTPTTVGTFTVTVIDSTHFSIPVNVTAVTTGTGTFTTSSSPPVPVYTGNDFGGGPLAGTNGPLKLQALPPVSKAVQAGEKNVTHESHHKGFQGHCSAFIATGPDWTTDGLPVIAHDTWSSWSGNFNYNFMYYIHPKYGYDYCYKAPGGNIWSGLDYYSNSSGLIMIETSVIDAADNPSGIPLFARAAEVAQYCSTCAQAEFDVDVTNPYTAADTSWQGGDGSGGAYMGFQAGTARSNGAYCNEWLIGDSTGTVASLILGALAYDYNSTTDGMFGSCNYGWGPYTNYENSKKTPTANGSGTVAASSSPGNWISNRWHRWLEIQAAYRGKGAIDPEVAMMFQGDIFDTINGNAHGNGDDGGSPADPYGLRG